MFVEMTGRASWEPPETGLELLTRAQLPPHLRHAPTRAEAGPGLWARVTAHPGLATRSRYGPGYLHHVQSWRHVPGMYVILTTAPCNSCPVCRDAGGGA